MSFTDTNPFCRKPTELCSNARFMIYIQRQNIEQFLALPFVDVCHLKPSAAVADSCFLIPSLFVS